MKKYELVAPCHFGLEAVTKREIYDLGYEITRVEDGRVTFEGDAEAVHALLRKGCAACLYAREVPRCRPLGEGDARLQRVIYQRSYARKKPSC